MLLIGSTYFGIVIIVLISAAIIGIFVGLVKAITMVISKIMYGAQRRQIEEDFIRQRGLFDKEQQRDRIEMHKLILEGMTSAEASYMVEVLDKKRKDAYRQKYAAYKNTCKKQDHAIRAYVIAIIIIFVSFAIILNL